MLRALVHHNPNVPEYAADLAGVQMNLGAAVGSERRSEGALVEMLAAVDSLRKLAGPKAAAPSTSDDLGRGPAGGGPVAGRTRSSQGARAPRGVEGGARQAGARAPGEARYTTELKATVDALAELNAI